MKISALGLIAFGPFTGIELDFGEGRGGLHVVYGPNEAGKSSALRALRHLLYGIPGRCSDDFIHPYAKLRISGKLTRSDGEALEFVRRKGTSGTLLTPDEKANVAEEELRSFLAGIEEDVFVNMFGIDHHALVKGGIEILQGGGELGQVLFSTGSGIPSLRKVQAELEAEAEALFKPSGQKPRINEGISSLRNKQKEIRETGLPSDEWVRHDKALRDALVRKGDLENDLEKKSGELGRLRRMQQALPHISRRKELLAEHSTYADAPLLQEGFTEKRLDLMRDLRTAKENETRALRARSEIDSHFMMVRSSSSTWV